MSPEDLMKEAAHLHQKIHQSDLPPQNEQERQADFVMSLMKKMVLALIMQKVSPKTLELTLFYTWLDLSTLNHGFSEDQCTYWKKNMELVFNPLTQMLRQAALEIKDDGPDPLMQELGGKIQQLKELANSLNIGKPSQDEIKRQTDIALRTCFGIIDESLKQKIHPSLIENTFFYYWLRTSTMNAGLEESFFQKLERNWPEIMKRVSTFVENLAKLR